MKRVQASPSTSDSVMKRAQAILVEHVSSVMKRAQVSPVEPVSSVMKRVQGVRSTTSAA
ncbi:hypothetical protein [Paenibacillus thiaminolyticus]|uniref:hypothetical protein n=1 Tax=Paenibacillus thiaminolyticus TaxID=49283 RepID=UPI0025428816|nr:hypothetical protein [Paenibacillus thiaminolyticus]WII35804.1 hypothetical protein O0V01_19190 [Paenibacillus thiaminolyticus]